MTGNPTSATPLSIFRDTRRRAVTKLVLGYIMACGGETSDEDDVIANYLGAKTDDVYRAVCALIKDKVISHRVSGGRILALVSERSGTVEEGLAAIMQALRMKTQVHEINHLIREQAHHQSAILRNPAHVEVIVMRAQPWLEHVRKNMYPWNEKRDMPYGLGHFLKHLQEILEWNAPPARGTARPSAPLTKTHL